MIEQHLLLSCRIPSRLIGNKISYPVTVQRAEYLFCILGRLTAHRPIAEMPLKLMQSDQTTWTFINKLSMTKQQRIHFFNKDKSCCNTQDKGTIWKKGYICS